MRETFRMSSLNQIVEDKRPNVRINVNRNSRRCRNLILRPVYLLSAKKKKHLKKKSIFLSK